MTESLLKVLNFFIPNALFHLAIICVFLLCFLNPCEIMNPFLSSHFLKEYGVFILIVPLYSFLFLILKLIVKWNNFRFAKKIQREREIENEFQLAKKIKGFDCTILNEIYRCISQDEEKIQRTKMLDHLIFVHGLRHFFEPRENDYIVNKDILRIAKKYHHIVFEDLYWSENYENQQSCLVQKFHNSK